MQHTGITVFVGCPFSTGSFFLLVLAFFARGGLGTSASESSDSGDALRFEPDVVRFGAIAA